MAHGLIKVWDPLVRIFHWSLVASFLLAYLTEFDVLNLHVYAGYVVCGLLVFRVFWGFSGPRHARFSDFVKSPADVLKYMRALLRGTSKRFIGHNPAGGTMVLVMLITLALTCISGVLLQGLEGDAGPFAFLHGQVSSRADDWTEEIHEVLSNMVAGFIVLHVAGVLWSSFLHRENLIKSMMSGRKRA